MEKFEIVKACEDFSKRINDLSSVINLEKTKVDIVNLEALQQAPDF